MAKLPVLAVGQKVWLETTYKHGCDVRYENEPEEMVVLEANKTSAYIWYNERTKVRFKVNQKTHQTKYAMPDGRSYRLWLSKEAYTQCTEEEKERKVLLQKAQEKLTQLHLEELREFVAL